VTDVAIYARLSQEDDAAKPGEMTGTERQIADCRARADREGWNVIGVYEDRDHSASSLRRKRPDFDRLLADLGDGVHVDHVLTYKLDRLLRHPKEAEAIIDLADRRGFGIVSLNDPGIDLATPTGRAMFRMTITWAKLETETMSTRIRRKARAIAEAGRPNGGGIRSFGLTADKTSIVPAEAALVREAAKRILGGEALHSIAVDWNDRGVRTPGRRSATEGRKWEVSSLKRMLTAPRIVGDRSHHGAIIAKSAVPALLDRDTYDAVCAVLTAPRGPVVSTVRKHPLTGLVFCGRCGAKLVARPDAHGTTRYACAPPRGCGGIVVAKRNLEPLIVEAIAIRLDSPEFRTAVEGTVADSGISDAMDQLRADDAALKEATSMYFVDRTISKADFAAVRATLNDRIEYTQRRIAHATSNRTLARVAGIDIRAEWERRPASWSHDVAAALIDKITVFPAPRRGTRFDPRRVDVRWLA
jgi:site-specific DNA recombinase